MKLLLTLGLLLSISVSETMESFMLLSGVEIHMEGMQKESEPEKESEENSEEKNKIEYFSTPSFFNNSVLDFLRTGGFSCYPFSSNQYLEVFSPPPE